MVSCGVQPSIGPLGTSTFTSLSSALVTITKIAPAHRPANMVDKVRSQSNHLAGGRPTWNPGGLCVDSHVTPWKTAPVLIKKGDAEQPQTGHSDAEPTSPASSSMLVAEAERRRRTGVCHKIGSYHHCDGDAALRQTSRIPALRAPKLKAARRSVTFASGGSILPGSASVPPSSPSQRQELPPALVVPQPPAAAAAALASALAVAEKAAAAAPKPKAPLMQQQQRRQHQQQPTLPGALLAESGGPAVVATIIAACADAASVKDSVACDTRGPLQVAVIKENGEMELQRVSSGDLSAAAQKAAAKQEAMKRRFEQCTKGPVVVKPPGYSKKKAGVLSKLLLMHVRSGSLAQEPPKRAFFQAW